MKPDSLHNHTEASQGHAAPWQTVPSIVTNAGDKAIAAYLGFLGQAKWSPSTRRVYSQHAGRFFRWAAQRGLILESIGAREVYAYASELAVTVSSQVVRVYLTPIYALLRHMVGAGVFFTDVFADEPYLRRVISAAREWPAPKIPLEELERAVLEIVENNRHSKMFKAGLVLLAEFSIETRDPAANSHFTGISERLVQTFANRLIEKGVWLPDGKICAEWGDPEHGSLAFLLDILVATGKLAKTYSSEEISPVAESNSLELTIPQSGSD